MAGLRRSTLLGIPAIFFDEISSRSVYSFAFSIFSILHSNFICTYFLSLASILSTTLHTAVSSMNGSGFFFVPCASRPGCVPEKYQGSYLGIKKINQGRYLGIFRGSVLDGTRRGRTKIHSAINSFPLIKFTIISIFSSFFNV